MPPTITPKLGLAMPAPTDLIDVTILNNNFQILDNFALTGSVVPMVDPARFADAYNIGVTMFPLYASNIGTYPGWAVGYSATTAEVLNFKSDTDRMTQIWFRSSTTNAEGWYRHLTSTTATPWRMLNDVDYASNNGTTGVTLPDSTWVKIGVQNVEGNNGFCIQNASTGFTIVKSGVYQVEAQCSFSSDPGCLLVWLGYGANNDTGPAINQRVNTQPAGSGVTLSGSWTRGFAANETVNMFVQAVSSPPPAPAKIASSRRMTIKRISW